MSGVYSYYFGTVNWRRKVAPSNKLKQFVVHITQGSGKLLGIPSINTPTHGNEFCELVRLIKGSVCEKCYAYRYETIRPSLVDALTRNLVMTERLLTIREIPRLNTQIARGDSYGELVNEIHFENYVAIARENPDTILTVWSKRSDIIRAVLSRIEKPANLILVFSTLMIDKTPTRIPKYFDKVFTVYNKGVSPDINCHGSCNTCRLCYSHNDVKFINEVKK